MPWWATTEAAPRSRVRMGLKALEQTGNSVLRDPGGREHAVLP